MEADLSKILKRGAGRYRVIVADPPWRETGGTGGRGGWSKSVGANAHYDTMTLEEILAMGPQVSRLAAKDAHLWLWTTNLQLANGNSASVVTSWGFRPLSVVTWRKTTGAGIGRYLRGKTEHCIFAVRGEARFPKKQGQTFYELEPSFDAPRASHSAKPPEIHLLAEQVSPRGPRVELFARGASRDGWDAWGLEAKGGRRG